MLAGIKFVPRRKEIKEKLPKCSNHNNKKPKYEQVDRSEVDFSFDSLHEDEHNHDLHRDDTSQVTHLSSAAESPSQSEYNLNSCNGRGLHNTSHYTTKYDNQQNINGCYPAVDYVDSKCPSVQQQQARSDAANPATTILNNHNVADLLRQKLKNKTSLSIETSANPNTIISKDDSTKDLDDEDQICIPKLQKQLELESQLAAANATTQLQGRGHEKLLTGPSVTLAQLVAAEKLSHNTKDMDDVYAENIIRLGGRYQGKELGMSSRAGADEDEEVDMKLFMDKSSRDAVINNKFNAKSNNNNKSTTQQKVEQEVAKEVVKAVKQQSYMDVIKASCPQCMCRDLHPSTMYPNTYRSNKHANSISTSTSICLSKSSKVCLLFKPPKLKLNASHCELIPYTQHAASLIECDEDTQKEIERYKNCLSYMFQRENKCMLSMECSHFHNSNSSFHSSSKSSNKNKIKFHTQLDIIGLEKNMLDEAIMFFKEEFVSMSHQGRLVELTLKRGLKKAVPVGFKYIAVEWGERITTTTATANTATLNKTNNSISETSKKGNRTMSDNCVGFVFIFDRENENNGSSSSGGGNGEDDNNNTSNQHFLDDDDISGVTADFCLDVLAGMFEEDSYRLRRRIKVFQENIPDEKKRFDNFLENWSTFDWTQYEV